MFELLLYTTLNCSEARELISSIRDHSDLPDAVKVELVETIKDAVTVRDFCNWDANDWRNGKTDSA